MCGIFGIIVSDGGIDVKDRIFEGLYQLQNRGYDSCGIGIMGNGEFILHKCSQDIPRNIDALEELGKIIKPLDYSQYNVGIGHNRWATHGGKTDINAHPHISKSGKFILVHNGIIENYNILRDFLSREMNYVFYSHTDTEIIVALLEYYHGITRNTIDAIKIVINELSGTYGLVILNVDEPDNMYCVRNGSPILVGMSECECIVTSEQSGFCNNMGSYITLDNDDICCISRNKMGITMTTSKTYTNRNITIDKREKTPNPYDHWTIKEIYDQSLIVQNAINLGGRIRSESSVKLGGLDSHNIELEQLDHIIILGCGSSFNSGECGAYFMKLLCNFDSVQVIDGAELTYHDIPNRGKTGFVLVSQSGETKDLHRCMEIAREKNILTIGVINVVDSMIARETDCGIYCNSGIEVGVASTKSFISQTVCLSLVALWFSEKHSMDVTLRKRVITSLRNLSNDISSTLDNVMEHITPIIERFHLTTTTSMFILGKGCDYYISNEGSLKIKELAYIHSEGYSASALKHGPFALLTEKTPVIILNCDPKHSDKIMNCYQEVSARNSPILLVTNDAHMDQCTIENIMRVEKNEYYGFILGLLPLQLLSYYVTIKKGYNPDKPRNLAKVVTVE